VGTLLLSAGSGGLLALHFWSWIASLEYTSVASSTVLVTTNPVWVALASVVLLRERPSGLAVIGIAIALLGTLLTFTADLHANDKFEHAAFGNGLAVIGAITASGYLLIGRALRNRLPLLSYVALSYSTAALLLGVGSALHGVQVSSFSNAAWIALVLLALGPQLIGHTAFNFSLRYMSATLVSLAILGEPIGAALLAWLLLGETFSAIQLAGFCLLLFGIYLAARGERRAAPAA
jgi:drug/metabolite transporter (DMT)-like permease